MNELQEGRPWGMCAAYGCPLFGSLGSGDRWWCFCHVNKPSGMNDEITQKLRSAELEAIVQTTLELRANFCALRDVPRVYRNMQERLRRIGREDLLLGEKDCSPHRPGKPIVKMWLARLEMELIDATGSARIQNAPALAPVIGPTHALQHYTERGEE